GPVLLMIPGAPADAGTFGAIAGQLADRYTVVSYDWRGSARSPLDEPAGDLPIHVQGDDAGHLLTAVADGPAYVLGCSGGAPPRPGAGGPAGRARPPGDDPAAGRGGVAAGVPAVL